MGTERSVLAARLAGGGGVREPWQAATSGSTMFPCQSGTPPAACPPATLQVRFCAALGLAHEVKLQPQPLQLGATPGIISPGVVSPAHTDEPGAAAACEARVFPRLHRRANTGQQRLSLHCAGSAAT